MDAKEAAARYAVQYVRSGMIVGIGTGSTSAYAIQALGERVANEGLAIRAVPTSEKSRLMAQERGIPIIELDDRHEIDITIDGADEIDGALNLIKGGGGALLREKIVASASREFIVIVDTGKVKSVLGAFPLPVVVVPFGRAATLQQLRQYCDNATLRQTPDGQPFVNDDGLNICDLPLGRILDVAALERNLRQIVGVVEVGLFTQMASRVIIGSADGRVEEKLPPR